MGKLLAMIASSPWQQLARDHNDVQSLDQLNDNLVDEIEHFFISYNAAKGKAFAPQGRFGPDGARRVIEAGEKQFRKRRT